MEVVKFVELRCFKIYCPICNKELGLSRFDNYYRCFDCVKYFKVNLIEKQLEELLEEEAKKND